jgi:hypothetical protein
MPADYLQGLGEMGNQEVLKDLGMHSKQVFEKHLKNFLGKWIGAIRQLGRILPAWKDKQDTASSCPQGAFHMRGSLKEGVEPGR